MKKGRRHTILYNSKEHNKATLVIEQEQKCTFSDEVDLAILRQLKGLDKKQKEPDEDDLYFQSVVASL